MCYFISLSHAHANSIITSFQPCLQVKEAQIALIRASAQANAFIREVHVVPDVAHGFAMRGSRRDAAVNEKRGLAEKMLVDFVRATCV